ncbi:MAG: hypothetical protein HOJ14_11125 [Nitrospina sp.]|nr:hypothetical protein [Nitrospina sp.]
MLRSGFFLLFYAARYEWFAQALLPSQYGCFEKEIVFNPMCMEWFFERIVLT